MISDVELSVRNGAELLDRLLKDIVSENSSFEIKPFILLLQNRLKCKNPAVLLFLLSWISFLDSIPGFDLIQYLPAFFDGLLNILTDSNNQEISTLCKNCLNDFLKSFSSTQLSKDDLKALLATIIVHLKSPIDTVRSLSLEFLIEFSSISKETIFNETSLILSCVLPSLGSNEFHIRQLAIKANNLISLIYTEFGAEKEAKDLVKMIIDEIRNENEATRVVALDWLLLIQKKSVNTNFILDNDSFHALLKALVISSSEEVIQRDLRLLAQISLSSDDESLRSFISNLLIILSQDTALLERRGNLIFRQLCIALTPEKLFATIAQILEDEKDLIFASLIVQYLNIILLTTNETKPLRTKLRNLDNRENQNLFYTLYKSWCHNPISVITLCLLSQSYDHASLLVLQM